LKENSIEDDTEDTFLQETVFTAPHFRKDAIGAERAMQVQYDEELKPRWRSIVGRPDTFQKYRAKVERSQEREQDPDRSFARLGNQTQIRQIIAPLSSLDITAPVDLITRAQQLHKERVKGWARQSRSILNSPTSFRKEHIR